MDDKLYIQVLEYEILYFIISWSSFYLQIGFSGVSSLQTVSFWRNLESTQSNLLHKLVTRSLLSSRLEEKEKRDRGRERNVDVERHIPQISFIVYIILVPLVVQQNKFLILFKSPFVNYLVWWDNNKVRNKTVDGFPVQLWSRNYPPNRQTKTVFWLTRTVEFKAKQN